MKIISPDRSVGEREGLNGEDVKDKEVESKENEIIESSASRSRSNQVQLKGNGW